jgi:hypothetical protein
MPAARTYNYTSAATRQTATPRMWWASQASRAAVTSYEWRVGERNPILMSKPCRWLPCWRFCNAMWDRSAYRVVYTACVNARRPCSASPRQLRDVRYPRAVVHSTFQRTRMEGMKPALNSTARTTSISKELSKSGGSAPLPCCRSRMPSSTHYRRSGGLNIPFATCSLAPPVADHQPVAATDRRLQHGTGGPPKWNLDFASAPTRLLTGARVGLLSESIERNHTWQPDAAFGSIGACRSAVPRNGLPRAGKLA